MPRATLRAVRPEDKPTPEQAWLALYRRRQALATELASINVGMRLNKVAAMNALDGTVWGLSDDQLARELERA